MLDNFLIVLVLYKMKLAESALFKSLASSVTGSDEKINMLVYDNSPERQFIPRYKNWNITYMHDILNSGVSKAYNEGAKIAKTLDKKWILIFDQDTVFEENALSKYCQSIEKYPHNELFVPILKCNGKIISPCKYYFKNGFLFRKEFYGLTSFRNKNILNSGMCISVKSFEEVGGYNERVKLYFSDFNFIDRYRKKHKAFVVIETIANHDLSFIDINLEKSITFYKNYCIGARSIVSNGLDFIILFFVVIYRLILLLVKFKRAVFIKIFSQHYLLGMN